MMESDAAVKTITQLADALSKGIAERLPRIALTKYAFYNATKQILRWVGVAVTKESFADAVAKIIPVLGGFFSGGLTAFMMTQMGIRLIKYLRENPFIPYQGAAVLCLIFLLQLFDKSSDQRCVHCCNCRPVSLIFPPWMLYNET